MSRPELGVREPSILAEIQRQAGMFSQHPENAAIDEWVEAVYDWNDFD